jgi:hypothetical protein
MGRLDRILVTVKSSAVETRTGPTAGSHFKLRAHVSIVVELFDGKRLIRSYEKGCRGICLIVGLKSYPDVDRLM